MMVFSQRSPKVQYLEVIGWQRQLCHNCCFFLSIYFRLPLLWCLILSRNHTHSHTHLMILFTAYFFFFLSLLFSIQWCKEASLELLTSSFLYICCLHRCNTKYSLWIKGPAHPRRCLRFTLFSLDVTLVSIIQQLQIHFYITNADGFTSCVTVHTS